MLIEFEINTKPVPQARPRFYVRHAGLKHIVGAYDPKKCKSFKEAVAWHAKIIAMEKAIREPLKGPISINLIFQMGENGNGKSMYHTKKPDIDNLATARL
jgi:Holliday junction resolvase RusA-like endonuclease